MNEGETLGVMEKLARTEFNKQWNANKDEIKGCRVSIRARYKQLIQASGKAVVHDWELPQQIVEKSGGKIWKNHLYANPKAEFSISLNNWEAEFLDWATKQDNFVCWLRNLPRRDWAFCVPYELGGEKAFYPDFVIVRRKGSSYEVDVLEPHDDSRVDTWAKVKGLAKFADEHHLDFGHLMLGRKKDGAMQVIDVSDDKIRKKALKMGASADLEALFESC